MRSTVLLLVVLLLTLAAPPAAAQDTAQDTEPITWDTLDALEEQGFVGTGVLLGAGPVLDGSRIAAVTPRGVFLHDPADLLATPAFIPMPPLREDDQRLLLATFVSPAFAPFFADDRIGVQLQAGYIVIDLTSGEAAYSDETVTPQIQLTDTAATADGTRTAAIVTIEDDGREETTLSLTTTDPASGTASQVLADVICGRNHSMFYSADGATLYVTDNTRDGTALMALDATSGDLLHHTPLYGAFVADIAYAPDGESLLMVVGGVDPSCGGNVPGTGIQRFDATTGLPTALLPYTGAAAAGIAVHDDLIAVGGFHTVSLWQAGAIVAEHNDEEGGFFSSARFSADGSHVAFDDGSRTLLWATDALRAGASPVVLETQGRGSGQSNIAFAGDNLLVFANEDGLNVYDPASETTTLVAPLDEPVFAVDANGTQLAAYTNLFAGENDDTMPGLFVYTLDTDTLTVTELWRDEVAAQFTPFLRFSPDGSVLLHMVDGRGDMAFPWTFAYNVADGMMSDVLEQSGGYPAAFRPDGGQLAVTVGGGVRLFGVGG